MRTAGFVLVGGRSTRMGQDKALLPWRHGTLVETLAQQVLHAAGNVALVGNKDAYSAAHLDFLFDLRPGLGPLSGIEAALESGRGELNLIVACDLALVETEWLSALLEAAKASQARCIIAQDRDGQAHPLCGVYHSNCLPVVKNALDQRRLKLMEVVEELAAERFQISAPIWNVNTPEEWQRCREIANGW